MEAVRWKVGSLLLLVVAVLVARPALTLSPGAAEERVPVVHGADPAKGTDPDACDGGRQLLEHYQELYGSGADGKPRFRHLVALVPDPVESKHTAYFDLVLEGVEAAVAVRVEESDPGTHDRVEASDPDARAPGKSPAVYVRDHSWLPWPDGDASKKQKRCWETHPGVIVYRPTQRVATEPPIAVFLVGETPTWGLRKEQFEEALELIDAFGEMPPSEREYLILGPTFSGTADSLYAALRRHSSATDKTRYFVSSGTARVSSIRQTIEAAGSNTVSVSYSSSAPPDTAVRKALHDFLLAHGGKCRDADGTGGNIVVFTETLTTYGALAGAGGGGDGPTRDCFTQRDFPPNLESIRRAYRSHDDAANASGIRAPIAAERPDEKPGNEMSDTTPVAHDLALGAVLRRLGGGQARFVGILATDASDVVFLAKRIRQQLPDVRLFTVGADILYLHPSYAQTLNGMLVAHSSFFRPLKGNNAPDSTALYVELVRNVFRAGRFLLAGKVFDACGVRISFIGNGSLWPVDDPARARRPFKVPLSFWFAFGLFAVVCIGIWVLILAPRTGLLRRRGALWGLVAPCAHADLAVDDRFVTASLLSVSVCPVLLMAVSLLVRDGNRSFGWGSAICASLSFVIIAGIWARVFTNRPRASTTTIVLTAGATIAAALALALGCGRGQTTTFNLFSGGSPILVGLVGLGSFGLALWCARVRLRMLDVHRFGVPAGARFGATVPPIAQALGLRLETSGLARAEQRLLAVIHDPWTQFTAVPALVHALLAVSIAVPFVIKFPHTFERGWRNWALVGFGCLAVLPVTGNLSRLLATWIVFKRMLRQLACVPAMAALRRLAPEQMRSLDAQLTHPSNDIVDLAPSVDALGRLSELGDHWKQKHETCAQLLHDELADEPLGTPADPCSPRRAQLVDGLLTLSAELARARAAYSPTSQALIDDFTVALIAVFLPGYVRHFRLFLPPLLLGSLVSVFMTSLYFVQPQRLIASLIFVWVAAIVGTMFVVYLALGRDPVIGAMAKPTVSDATINWGLVRRVVTWGVVPLASLMAAQYPEFAFHISTLLEAVTKVFR